jgi:hypothetical protein
MSLTHILCPARASNHSARQVIAANFRASKGSITAPPCLTHLFVNRGTWGIPEFSCHKTFYATCDARPEGAETTRYRKALFRHCMVDSPKLSPWFYEYERRNCRLSPPTPPTGNQSPAPPAPAKRRGFAPGVPQKRFTEPQRQTIIDLIKEHPHSPSTVAEEFAKAWPGLTVTKVSIHKFKQKAMTPGKLQPA